MRAPGPAGLRWRPRTFALLGAAGAILLVAVATRDPVALFLALPLLVAPAAAALVGPRTSPRARLSWDEGGVGPEVHVSGTVLPDPSIGASDLVVELPRPAGLVEGEAPRTEPAGDRVELRRWWYAPEPTITIIDPPTVVWRDPAGLVERAVTLEGDPLTAVRYPAELVRLRTVRLDRTTVLPGETRSRRLGASGEFFGVRESEFGDPPRRINWRASARAGHLLANEFALERTGDLLLLLDARPTELGRRVDEHLLSIARAAAEGIAESFLFAKARVGLGIYGEFLEVVPLSTGRTQRARIRTALAGARLTPRPGPSERCALALRRYVPGGVTTILISPLAGDESTSLVPHLRRRGYPIVVLSPSPVPLLSADVPLPPEDDRLAERLLRLARRNEIRRMWDIAPVVDWSDFTSLGTFVEFLRRPRTRRFG